MYEILDGNVVKRESIEVITPTTSEDIYNEIKSLDSIIADLSKTKDALNTDLEIVLKLEGQIKQKTNGKFTKV